jgi:lysylphosphatidylglycerol synthetase-like protein (DUF2156 family)
LPEKGKGYIPFFITDAEEALLSVACCASHLYLIAFSAINQTDRASFAVFISLFLILILLLMRNLRNIKEFVDSYIIAIILRLLLGLA